MQAPRIALARILAEDASSTDPTPRPGNSWPTSPSSPTPTLTFSPVTMTAAMTYHTSTQTWVTDVPLSGLSDTNFLSGVGFAVPSGGLPGGIKPVTWEGDFLTDTPGVRIPNWKWAAVYNNTKAPTPFPSGFVVDHNPIGVKPVER
jgi:hypothetical protein